MTPESARLRGAVVIAVAFFLYEAVFSGFRVDGVRPDLLMAVTVAFAIVGGPASGAGVGFLCGILADLFVNTPFGLTALVLCLIGFAIGSLQQAIGAGQRGSVPVLTTVASVAAVLMWAVLGTVLGLPALLHLHLVVVVGVVAGVNAAISIPLARVARWVFEPTARAATARRGFVG